MSTSSFAMDKSLRPRLNDVKALVFDLMGTCTNWAASISAQLAALNLEIRDCDAFALEWREAFFERAHSMASSSNVEALSDIDAVHHETLQALTLRKGISLTEEQERACVQAWHSQRGWPDAVPGLDRLRLRYDTLVLANGTTRLQLDITRTAGLHFNTLLSSQLLRSVKPRPEMYRRTLELLALEPQQVLFVAAHAYDTKAAKREGYMTAYIRRETEDRGLNFDQIRKDNDIYIEKGGLEALADGMSC